MAGSDIAGENYKRRQRQRAADRACDERPAIERLFSAYMVLQAQGWQPIMYAPKDGTEIEVIELGSTGIHKSTWQSFDHKPLDDCGAFFTGDDAWTVSPVLFRKIKS